MTALSLPESSALAEYEAAIEAEREGFLDRSSSLFVAIRDQRLYRATCATFELYCLQRWGLTRQHVNRLIRHAEVTAALEPTGSKVNEAQARELAPLLDQPDALRDAWQQANEQTGGKPTAAAIRAVVRPAPVASATTTSTQKDSVHVDTGTGEVLADAVTRYPELQHYAEDRPEKAVTLAAALDGYDDTEREMRREVLGKRIAAEREGRMPAPVPAVPMVVWHAEQMFAAANQAAIVIGQHGGDVNFFAAAVEVDPLLLRTWREQFQALAQQCSSIADACATPGLRSVQ